MEFFLGWNREDRSSNIEVNYNNEIIIAGKTQSSDFPILNAYDTDLNGIQDVYLTKFNSDGDMIWSTYFGGISVEEVRGIAISN